MLEVFKHYLRRGSEPETLLSKERLDNIDECVRSIFANKVEGDFIECGVWRGGACMYMRALLWEYDDRTRKVWVADSFQGLPKPDADKYPIDCGYPNAHGALAVSLDEVRGRFQKYGLDDGQTVFWPGFFKDSLPACPIGKIALLRLDGDLYESTIQPLEYLYDKVAPLGWIIIDDYFHWNCAGPATDDFRSARHITDRLYQTTDGVGAFWQKNAVAEDLIAHSGWRKIT